MNKPLHFKAMPEGRSLEAMIGSYGIRTRHIVTNEDLAAMVRDVFNLKGETLAELHREATALGRGARRKMAKAYLASLEPRDLSKAVCFSYKNYRGEVSSRLVTPGELFLADARHEYHPKQWCIRGWDHEKKAFRDFATSGIMGPWSAVTEERT